jgi:hypothetical protein
LHARISLRRALFAFIAVALCLVALCQVWLTLTVFSFLNDYATPGGFGTPLGRLAPVREAILARNPAQVLLRLDGGAVGFDEESTVWDVLLDRVPDRRPMPPEIDVFPKEPALLLESSCVRGGQTFAMRPTQTGVPEKCYRLSARTSLDLAVWDYSSLEKPARFENGASLIAMSWESPGCLNFVWELDGPAAGPANDAFNMALHFVDTAGEQLVVADMPFWAGRYWRAGDRLVVSRCLDAAQFPAGVTWQDLAAVRVGLYTLDDTGALAHTNAVDAAGATIGPLVEIDLAPDPLHGVP